MNPLALFVLAFFIWITSPLYLSRLSHRLKARLGEIAAYWTLVSAFDVILAVFVTLLCPGVYFIRWSFPVKVFLILFAFAVLSLLPAIDELGRFLNPRTKEEREMVGLIKKVSFTQLAVLQIISAALPEEIIFRYILLGLLSLWNPFAGLIAVSLFFGISHKFSHPGRKWKVLLSNTLTGFVLSLGYLYTKSLLVVMAIHWLGNTIPELYVKYEGARRVILAGVALTLSSPLVFWGETVKMTRHLGEIYSPSGLLWGVLLGVGMLAVVCVKIKAVKGRGGR